jgi:hypothetical protein
VRRKKREVEDRRRKEVNDSKEWLKKVNTRFND